MKKRIIAILLTIVLCLSFCGCDALDEMRTESFDWGNKEKTILISRDGTEYKKVPNDKNRLIEFSDLDFGYIADSEDVPLLLTNFYGEYVSTDINKNFISFSANEKGEPNSGKGSETVFFCRSDRYDEINRFINKQSVGTYGYYYYDESGNQQFRELTKLERSAISLTYDEGYTQIPRKEHSCEKSIEIDRFNEAGDLWINSYYIQRVDGRYCICVFFESFVWVYTVPDEQVPTFMLITKEAFNQ